MNSKIFSKFIFILLMVFAKTSVAVDIKTYTWEGGVYARDLNVLYDSVSDYSKHLQLVDREFRHISNFGHITKIEEIQDYYRALLAYVVIAKKVSDHAFDIQKKLENRLSTNPQLPLIGPLVNSESPVLKDQILKFKTQGENLLEMAKAAEKRRTEVHDLLLKAYALMAKAYENQVSDAFKNGYSETQNKVLCQRFSSKGLKALAISKTEFLDGEMKSDLYQMIMAQRKNEMIYQENSEIKKICGNDSSLPQTSPLKENETFRSKDFWVNRAALITRSCTQIPKDIYPEAKSACETSNSNPSFLYWLHTLRKSL